MYTFKDLLEIKISKNLLIQLRIDRLKLLLVKLIDTQTNYNALHIKEFGYVRW